MPATLLRLLLVAALAVAGTTPQAVANGADVQVAGLQIVGPGLGRNGSELQAFNQSAGLTVALAFSAPAGTKIVEIDDDRCTLDALEQNDGTSILEEARWGPFPDVTESGEQALVDFTNGRRPSAGTSALRARGQIHLRVAREVKTAAVDGFAARTGVEFEAAGSSFKVQVAEKDAEYGSYRLVLETTADTAERVREFRFADAAGDAIESGGRGSMTMGSRTQLEFYLDESAVPDSLEIEWYDGLETVELPFDLEIQLSLGG